MRLSHLATFAAVFGVIAVAMPLHPQGAKPATGADVLELMHAKYNNKWYRTLTFSQKTTMAGRGGGAPTEQTWYESLQFAEPNGASLRIDQGNPNAGNGSLSTADSTWGVRSGSLTRSRGTGNPFIPMIENVYLQPVAVTVKQLEPLHFDMSRVADGMWEGRPAWVVGAASATDSTSPQFWIDKDRLVIVRMLLLVAPGRPPYDIQLGKYVETGGGWLATKVTMFSGGVAQQTEEYYDWKTNATLDPKLFDVATWSTATHWVKQP